MKFLSKFLEERKGGEEWGCWQALPVNIPAYFALSNVIATVNSLCLLQNL
jgi:hypothetical protein